MSEAAQEAVASAVAQQNSQNGPTPQQQPNGQGQAPAQQQTAPVQPQQQIRMNPAWEPFLSKIPQSLHPDILPILKQWDDGVNNRFQTVQSQYSPYKEFAEAQIDPDTLRYGLGIIQALEDDPRRVYDAIAQLNGFADQGQLQEQQQGIAPEGSDLPPEIQEALGRLQTHEQGLELMSQWVLNQEEERVASQADYDLDQELNDAFGKAGVDPSKDPHVEPFVLAMMQNGMETDQAIGAYLQMREGAVAQSQRSASPRVLSGGGVTSNAVPNTRQGRVDLLAQALKNGQ